jgi:hypothetical protein
VADQAHHIGALALEFVAEAHDEDGPGDLSGAGSATPTGSPLQKSSAFGPAEREGGGAGEGAPPRDPPSRMRSKSERLMRTRRPTRTAGSRPWSIQLRTVCWLTLNHSATSATVKKDSSRSALIARNFSN